GRKPLAQLFDGRSQLVVYHFMFAPGWKAGCVGCSFLADHVDGANQHLRQHDLTFVAISRAPLPEIQAYKKRMGRRFNWVSAYARGDERGLGTYMYLDLTPKGRNENGPNYNLMDWVRRHDEYANSVESPGHSPGPQE